MTTSTVTHPLTQALEALEANPSNPLRRHAMKPTHSKSYVANWEAYIDDSLEVEGCEGEPIAKKLAYAISEFQRVASYPHNLRKFPNVQDRLADYLAGLPFHFAYSYHDILETAGRLHQCAIPEDKQDMICEQWFRHCAIMLMKVAAKHKLTFYGATP